MKIRSVSAIVLTLLLTGMLTLAFEVQLVEAVGAVCIRADGSVDPPTAQIRRVGDVYTLTGNLTSDGDGIVVERDNIVVDGAGYTLQGTEIGAKIGAGILLIERSNVTLKNMEIKAFDVGIFLVESSNGTISGNRIANSDLYGIMLGFPGELRASNNNSIHNNTIENSYGAAIHLIRSSNNTLFGNNITKNGNSTGCVAHGILIAHSSSGNVASGNNITKNGSGITLHTSSGNIVSGNDITANGEYGILLRASSNTTVHGNNVASNGKAGIRLWDVEKGFGIKLFSSSDNIISGNNITENEKWGICFGFSSNNSIYHNNFVNNTQQVHDIKWDFRDESYIDFSINVWDDGREGNYWSDYEGRDVNGDGIGDSPYNIHEYNQDSHPLMSPWTPTWRPIPLWMQWWFWRIVTTTVGIVGLAGAVYWKKRKETQH